MQESHDNTMDFDSEEVYEVMTLIGDDGDEMDYLVIDSLEDNGNTYSLIISSDDGDEEIAEAAEAVIVKHMEIDGKSVCVELEDGDEFDRIAALFEGDDKDYVLEV